MKNADTYFHLAREREAIRRHKLTGEPWPWTDDPIFRAWKFTNVFREHDRTTVWFRENVRSVLSGLGLVEAVIIFRWFNRIETGERVLDLLLNGWDAREARRRLGAVEPGHVFTGAYIINTPEGMSKLDGVLYLIEKARPLLPALVSTWGSSLEAAWLSLAHATERLGNFTAYEIVSDLRWTPILDGAEDVNTWAAAGPGCARGLGWIADGNPKRYNYERDQTEMLAAMRELLAMSRDEGSWPRAWGPWEMREVEHWACETAKYIRCRDGGRPPRERYHPSDLVRGQQLLAFA